MTVTIQRGYCQHRDMLAPLVASGLVPKVVFLEGRGAETMDWCLASFRARPGRLFVAPDLTIFGQAKKDVSAVMARMERASIRVMDVIHPQDETVAEMLHRAFAIISRPRLDKRAARRRGRKGGLAKGEAEAQARAGIAPDWLVRNIATDPALTWAVRLRLLDDKISKSTLRRKYGDGA